LATVNALEVFVDHVMYWPKGFRPVMRGNNPGDTPYLTLYLSARGDA
jgi:hypothetical protein